MDTKPPRVRRIWTTFSLTSTSTSPFILQNKSFWWGGWGTYAFPKMSWFFVALKMHLCTNIAVYLVLWANSPSKPGKLISILFILHVLDNVTIHITETYQTVLLLLKIISSCHDSLKVFFLHIMKHYFSADNIKCFITCSSICWQCKCL